ncbi:MAG: 50S ribosomal protein L17 [Candidatus Dormiibacterota bacterium]|jgi:large subunit ribosomal protein L17|nr:50S ribosomal protein L17 [Candidatus Dormibacteraeota bacterium]
MRHNKSGRKFGRTSAHRQSMTNNQITSLLRAGRIETTEAKAKELRRWVERVITTAKADDLAARRAVIKHVTDPDVTDRLFTNLMPRLKERPGGYTRIIRKGPRHGDGAPMVLIELVD